MKNIHITYISHISKYVTYVQIICYFYLGNNDMSTRVWDGVILHDRTFTLAGPWLSTSSDSNGDSIGCRRMASCEALLVLQ